MRLVSQATSLTLLLTSSGAASASNMGMESFRAIALLALYYAAFFILQFVVCCIVAARRMISGKRLSGAAYFLVPIETAAISALAIYFFDEFFPKDSYGSVTNFPIGLFGLLLITVLAPPITWFLLHIVLHRSRAATAPRSS